MSEVSAPASGLTCPKCGTAVFDIDVKCGACGHALGSTGSQRLIGTTVLAQYEIVDVLGQGGMSVVYKGRHTITGQEVALKLLPPELAAHAQVKSRFVEEARALAALDHPNIVHLYNFGQENGSFVLAMQLVRGKTWERMILEHGRLGWAVSTRIAIDVLRALEYAHGRGVIHRDMKPSNVLVRADDGAATVMDFGIAKMTTSTKLTATGQTMGTVRYMSPEQVRGQEVDAGTDVYSLGATLYESLVGDTPFEGDTHFEIMTKHLSEMPIAPGARNVPVPPALDVAVMRALQKKSADRFASARDFRKALEDVLTSTENNPEVGAAARRLSRDSITPAVQRDALGTHGKTQAAGARADLGGASRGAATPTMMTTPLTQRRAWRTAWIGLALLLVAATATVAAILVLRAPPVAPAVLVASAPQFAAYRPVGITLSPPVRDATIALDASSAGALPASELLTTTVRELAAFNAYATKMGARSPFVPDFLHVIAVPAQVLCDETTYSERRVDGSVGVVKPPANCASSGMYYRPTDRTLLVNDAVANLTANVRLGLVDAVQIHRPDLTDIATAFGAAP